MTKEELRQQFKYLVAYLLDCERSTNNETIEAYTDSFMFGASQLIKKDTIYKADWTRENKEDITTRK